MRRSALAIIIAALAAGGTNARSIWHDKPAAIEPGEYLIDSITPATQNLIAHTRIAANPKIDTEWGMRWGDPFGDFSTARLIIPEFRPHNDTYRDRQVMLQIERTEDGATRVISCTPLGDMADTDGRPNSLKLFYEQSTDKIHVYVGSDMQHMVGSYALSAPCKVWYFTCCPSNLVGCGALVLDGKGCAIRQSSRFTDTDSLMAHIKQSVDPCEGVWRYLDRNVDEKIAATGGRYTLATVANEKGGYDIIYLAGADMNDALWCPLGIKGTLSPTIFKGNYDMKWIDAEGREYAEDTNAQYADDGSILTLYFPALKSQLRFSRMILR